ncbi:MAG: patatin-like phospholipase family protein [Balneolaceae bacterium]|nr:patatin-like phospholipase family protein [Balneolaceae bacterium]
MIQDEQKVNGHERSSSTSSPKKTFKILSIDGGGIKGLYPARILQHIEERFQTRIADQFDMICGTSTGGLIALGLSIGKPASNIVKLYQEKGQLIFPEPKNRFRRVIQKVNQLVGKGKYDKDELEKALHDFFGNKTLSEAKTYLNIPSYNLTIGQPRVFKKPHVEGGLFKDETITMVDAALATSAAPSYLPIHQINSALYCDGGMWANNPSLTGLIEALDYFVGEDKEYDSYSILSLPTISNPTGWAGKASKNMSLKDWGGKILDPSMEGQSYFTDFMTRKIVKHTKAPGQYYRVSQPNLSAEHISMIALDNTSESALKLLTEFGDQTAADLISKGQLNNYITI